MNQNWELIQVGMQRPEWAGMADGLLMDWTDECGLTLFAFFKQPNAEEQKAMAVSSPLEIAFKDMDGVGFFAVKFGGLPWGDCVFSPNLYPEIPKFETLVKGKGYALNIMLVDTLPGELKLIRTIALGHEFSKKFRDWALKSLDRNIGQKYYNQKIEEAFAKYPTSEKLAAASDFRWAYPHGEQRPIREEFERE